MLLLRKMPKSLPVVIYVLFIYVTLPVMRNILNFAKDRLGDLFNSATTFFLVAFLFTIVVMMIHHRLSWQRWLIIFFVLLGYGISLELLHIPEERMHLLEYGFLSFLTYRMYRVKATWRRAAFYAFFTVSFCGTLDEVIQHFLPNRVGDLRDVVINMWSGLLGLILVLVVDRKKVLT